MDCIQSILLHEAEDESTGTSSSRRSDSGNDDVSSDQIAKNQETALVTDSALDAAKDDDKDVAKEAGN
ncbi:hypothetical protein SLEP1_g40297 [Rubroshorea leprosula]|uniref:Uncharacterized protein n=1 Tax=Rubroshorea leprosula TaxID=152421 RepID=A0AAV5L3D8_9ROSI|nr:hypothetical protein SLEP1_g40297 [Rubroshorea leprosula]